MHNRPPITEQVGTGWTPGWVNWLTQVFQCLPWKKGFNATATLDFGMISAQSQAGLPVTVQGARPGDAVLVTPGGEVTGVIFTGIVTAADQVTVYAKNFGAGTVNPVATTFRIIVLQN